MLLCTPIQLADRRTAFARDIHINRNSSDDIPDAALVMRPCVVRTLSRNEDQMRVPRSASTKGSSTSLKPSLVIYSLDMQPDTKTLAKTTIKRDPLKLPFFCKQYNQIKKDIHAQNHHHQHHNHQTPRSKDHDGLMVRGVEILHDQQSPPGDAISDGDDDNLSRYIPKELQIQLTDCCECMRDVNIFKRELQIGQMMNEPEKYLIVNENGNQSRERDRHQQRLPHSTAPFPPPFNGKGLSAPPIASTKVADSNTRRIIHVTVNNKKLSSS